MPSFEVEDISVTQQNFKPDPSLGKNRSELELFDEALKNSIRSDLFDSHNFPMATNNQMDEVHHTISGVIITSTTTEHAAPAGPAKPAANIGGIDTVPPFSPPPVTESANTKRADERIFSEPTFFSRTDLIQVYTTSSQLFTTTE